MSPQKAAPLASATAQDWMFLAASGTDAVGLAVLLGGVGVAATAVAWTPASDPGVAGWALQKVDKEIDDE
jgi:hypothetical protein